MQGDLFAQCSAVSSRIYSLFQHQITNITKLVVFLQGNFATMITSSNSLGNNFETGYAKLPVNLLPFMPT
ncbi:hypothetical protein KIN20_035011 [Parelaphostrongylus tenuis]|uniref:Uncharacterized protein n=1 Tax=Parelaphostrongylus tenuis TaxID=148309 RepID=A0AAD5RAI6_PARTN|nr:hypothetical protein KIN20_035011 [Parelaphostrongylus tenuis]